MKLLKFAVFPLAALVLALPVFLRAPFGGFFVGDSYHYLELAKHGTGFYSSVLSFFISAGISLKLVQFSLGLLSFVLFYLLVSRLSRDSCAFSCFVLALSPLFVYSFNALSPMSLAVPVALMVFYLFSVRGFLFSLPFFVPLFFVSPLMVVFVLFVLACAFFVVRKRYLYFIFAHALALAVFGVFVLFSGSLFSAVPVSDLGAFDGFGIFDVVLAVVGFTVMWKNRDFLFSYSALFALLLFYLAGFDVLPALLFAVVFFAGHGFSWFYRRSWHVGLVKQLTLILIVCGLVFSSVSYITRVSSALPDSSIADSLSWLGEHSKRGVVLSHESNRYFVGYFSGFSFTSANETVFYSRNLETTKGVLHKYDVSYIFITPEMKSGLVWSRDNDGLLFLFRNKEVFENIYMKDGIEVWKVLE